MISPGTPEGAKGGWLARLKRGLSKTRVNIVGLFSGGVVDDAFLEELEMALIGADVGVSTSTQLIEAVRSEIKLKGLKSQEEVRIALRDELARRLAPAQGRLDLAHERPYVVMVCGVNGSGKTTSIGKLAKWFAGQQRSVLLAAGDTFRAAAREQLAVWGARNSVDVIAQSGGDPAAVVFDAVSAAKARGVDVLIADTAGRLPTQAHLMEELKRIRRAQDKALPGAPHEVILIVDGTNGQNALAQVQAFDAAVGLTGLVVTKLDGTAKGGVLAAIAAARGDRPLPILFIGVGEAIDDLQPFSAVEFADALVGPGAVQ
jgi:fused signal recognition particle receptor